MTGASSTAACAGAGHRIPRARLQGTPRLVLLDVDGTLAPIAARPELVELPDETMAALLQLTACAGTTVAIVTGRSIADARRIVPLEHAWFVGNHGAEIAAPGAAIEVDAAAIQYAPAIASAEALLGSLPLPAGVIVESKVWSASVHYRLADPAVEPALRARVEAAAAAHGLRVTTGKCIFEVRPPVHVTKGTAALALVGRIGADVPGAVIVAVGDDVTDEDMFVALRAATARSTTVRVAPAGVTTAAEFVIDDPRSVCDLIDLMGRVG